MNTLKCSICKETKPTSEFYEDKSKKRGFKYECKECTKKMRRETYKKDPEKHRESNKRYYKNNPGARSNKSWENKLKVIKIYGGKCECEGCDITFPEFLTIDHIGGTGARHRAGDKRGKGMFTLLAKYTERLEGLRLLCWNCNCADGKYGYCPHHQSRPEPTINPTYIMSDIQAQRLERILRHKELDAQGLDGKEIAKITGYSSSTVYTDLQYKSYNDSIISNSQIEKMDRIVMHKELFEQGLSIQTISKQTGFARHTVKKDVNVGLTIKNPKEFAPVVVPPINSMEE